MQKRDISIDILRAIALLGLIAAHVTTSDFVFQLRSFDVPMMVFLSGVVYSNSKTASSRYTTYVYKRFVRIIIPTWIFIVLYFGLIKHDEFATLISRFSLLTDWFVWIMRVFFIIAIVAPIISKFLDSISTIKCYYALLVLLLFNEILCRLPIAYGRSADINVIIIMNVAYMLIFCLGYIINRTNIKVIHLFIMLFSLLYIIVAGWYWYRTGEYVLTQTQKYPPRLYYLAYAFAWIYGLWVLKGTITKLARKLHLDRFLSFVGSHTMWIYFWHIVVLDYISVFESTTERYAVTLIVSVTITFIQHKIIERVTNNSSPLIAKYSRMIFDG